MRGLNMMTFLIEQCGLSVDQAVALIQHDDSDLIIAYMQKAFAGGKRSVIQMYQTNDGK